VAAPSEVWGRRIHFQPVRVLALAQLAETGLALAEPVSVQVEQD